jgi:hypothetical protein
MHADLLVSFNAVKLFQESGFQIFFLLSCHISLELSFVNHWH